MDQNNGQKVLEVKDLRISFKTNGGTVKAVRGISFSLFRGRTLAIVGESGSGKSVTSKAILGILANNKIVEGGQIIYDGKDLLQVSEEAFSKIRGVKISMIFQDPLSSLNPIMIVGKQLTEAMLLKNKASRRYGKRYVASIAKAISAFDKEKAKELSKLALGDDEAALKTYVEGHEDLFLEAAKRALSDQKVAIAAALEALEAYQNAVLQGEFDLKEAYKAGKAVFKAVDGCQLALTDDPDDVISTFKTVLYNAVSKEARAVVLRAKQGKDFEKYGVDNIFDLPPEARAKESEIIPSSEETRGEYREAVSFLIAHLEEVAGKIDDLGETYAQYIEKAFLDYAKDAKKELSKAEAKEKAISLLREVGIDEPERRYKQYPFELSGGMRQRIVIAIALSSSPEVLICDEPTTALDVTIQAQILELINKLKAERHLSIVFITHDLGVVANMADDIAVMYAGKIVEYGTAEEIFYDPRHPYTWALLGSMPDLETKERLHAIPGTPPNMLLPPKGDAFAARNEFALKIDELKEPPFFEVSPTHFAATWMLHENAPEVEVPSIVRERIAKALKDHPDSMPKPTNYKNSVLEHLEKEAKQK